MLSGKPDLVKRHHTCPSDRATRRGRYPLATCVRDCRKLSASRADGDVDPRPRRSSVPPFRDMTAPVPRAAGSRAPRRIDEADQPPPCIQRRGQRAMAGTIREGPADPTIRHMQDVGEDARPPAEDAGKERSRSGSKDEPPGRQFGRSASIEVARSRKSSLPVFTKSPMAVSAEVKAPTSAPLPMSPADVARLGGVGRRAQRSPPASRSQRRPRPRPPQTRIPRPPACTLGSEAVSPLSPPSVAEASSIRSTRLRLPSPYRSRHPSAPANWPRARPAASRASRRFARSHRPGRGHRRPWCQAEIGRFQIGA